MTKMANALKSTSIALIYASYWLSASCTSELKVVDAYYQKIRSGRQGVSEETEFVIKLKNPSKKSIKMERANIYEYGDFNYYFDEIIPNDTLLSKTLSDTKGIQYFTIFLTTRRIANKSPAVSNTIPTYADLYYLVNSKRRTIPVKKFRDEGYKQMRK